MEVVEYIFCQNMYYLQQARHTQAKRSEQEIKELKLKEVRNFSYLMTIEK